MNIGNNGIFKNKKPNYSCYVPKAKDSPNTEHRKLCTACSKLNSHLTGEQRIVLVPPGNNISNDSRSTYQLSAAIEMASKKDIKKSDSVTSKKSMRRQPSQLPCVIQSKNYTDIIEANRGSTNNSLTTSSSKEALILSGKSLSLIK